MPVPNTMADLNVTASLDNPPGSEIVGTNASSYHRAEQAIIRRESAVGANISSAATITPGNDGNYFTVTGTTTITAIANTWVGRQVVLQTSGILQLTHSSNLILPSGLNITTAPGNVYRFVQESATPVWRLINQIKPEPDLIIAKLGSFSVTLGTNLDLTGFNTTLYEKYTIDISATMGTDGALINLKLSNDAGISFPLGHYGRVIRLIGGTPDQGASLGGSSIALSLGGADNSTDRHGVRGTVELYNPFNPPGDIGPTCPRLVWSLNFWDNNNNTISGIHGHGTLEQDNFVVNLLRFSASAGVMTMRARMYGWLK